MTASLWFITFLSLLLAGCSSRIEEEASRMSVRMSDGSAPSDSSSGSGEPDLREVVVLVHGMGRSGDSMKPLGESLATAGYEARVFDYDSFGAEAAESAVALRTLLGELDADGSIAGIHLVGHSLGGILARMALIDAPPERFGRLVMLAPPNQGSGWARVLGPALSRWIPPLDDLSNEEGSVVRSLPAPTGYQLGVIAARFDGKVSVEATHVEGESDHLVVNGVHSFLMKQDEVQRQVAWFLREGSFERAPSREE